MSLYISAVSQNVIITHFRHKSSSFSALKIYLASEAMSKVQLTCANKISVSSSQLQLIFSVHPTELEKCPIRTYI